MSSKCAKHKTGDSPSAASAASAASTASAAASAAVPLIIGTSTPLSEAVQQACANPNEPSSLGGGQAVFYDGVLAISGQNDRANHEIIKHFLRDEYKSKFPGLHSVPHYTPLPGVDESACLLAFLCYLHDKFGGHAFIGKHLVTKGSKAKSVLANEDGTPLGTPKEGVNLSAFRDYLEAVSEAYKKAAPQMSPYDKRIVFGEAGFKLSLYELLEKLINEEFPGMTMLDVESITVVGETHSSRSNKYSVSLLVKVKDLSALMSRIQESEKALFAEHPWFGWANWPKYLGIDIDPIKKYRENRGFCIASIADYKKNEIQLAGESFQYVRPHVWSVIEQVRAHLFGMCPPPSTVPMC